jgi:threonine synthase
MAQSWLECVRGCGRRYSIFEVIYRCEECGGLLDVQHDVDQLGTRSADEWKQLFDNRLMRGQKSGVWGKKEWVCPLVEDENIISMGEGGSSLLAAEKFGQEIGVPDLWIKLCGNSHTGSFKDLGMTVLVSAVNQMRKNGAPIRAVACASTGDTSAALAAYAAAANIPAVILLPRGKISTAQLVQPIANGALVLSLDTDFDGCMRIVQELTGDPTIYLANSMNSLRMEGQKSVAIEIVQQFGWEVPDWVVIPSGNLGNVSALGKGFQLMKDLGLIDRLPRLACAQSAAANPLFLSYLTGFEEYRPVIAGETLASAIRIGDPVSYERAVKVLKTFDGVVEQADEFELADAAARADRTGFYTCPHTAVALAALEKLAARNVITAGERVVVISTAHGLKFTDFKTRYHENRLDATSARFANTPVEIPANIGAVNRAIDSVITG